MTNEVQDSPQKSNKPLLKSFDHISEYPEGYDDSQLNEKEKENNLFPKIDLKETINNLKYNKKNKVANLPHTSTQGLPNG